MDGVEILMDVEDHFGISMNDSEAGQVRTVGDLVAIVRARIEAARREYCPTLPAFLLLRRTVRGILGDESVRLRPRHAVSSVLNAAQRRALWEQLSDLMGTAPRPLRRPKILRRILVLCSLATFLLALGSAFVIDILILPLTLLIAVGVILLFHFLTLPFRSIPPAGWTTFGEIANKIVGLRIATKMIHLRTDDEILEELRPLLVNVLGVDASEITHSARFVEDLGMS